MAVACGSVKIKRGTMQPPKLRSGCIVPRSRLTVRCFAGLKSAPAVIAALRLGRGGEREVAD